MNIKAVIDKSTIDAEGETTLTLKIPLQYRDQSLELMKYSQTVLNITIEPDNKPYYQAITPTEL